MTRKLLTLLTFALLGIGSVWAVDFTCSATVPAGQEGTFSNTEGIAGTNCTLKYSGLQGGSNVITVNNVDYYKLGSDNAYVQILLSFGSFTKFQAGDVLTATVTSNVGDSKKSVDVRVGNSSATSKVSVSSNETQSIVYTLKAEDIEEDGSIKIYRNSAGSNLRVAVFKVTGTRSTETFTVTFNAGTNGTCGTASLTEESVGAGVTLPAVTANDGYVFNGWFTAATEGTKAGNAGALYMPTANVTLYAQYSALAAPTISIANTNVSTPRGSSVTLTATVTGSPAPTVTWYQNETATTTGGAQVGTGSTYNPDVTIGGTFYYYAVASNGIGNDAVSDVVTLEVTNPDLTISGNNFYVAVGDLAIPQQNIICDDITMQYSDGTYSNATKDETTKSIVSGFVASINCSTSGWGVTFTPSKPGALKVGVVINGDKTFTITNVTGFSYQSPNGSGTISSNTWKPSTKQYTVITIKVVPGVSYKFSVAGSKMGFYGFEFTPVSEVTGTITASGYNTYSSNYPLDLSTINGGVAYVATGIENGKVVLTKCTAKVPAATGLFIAGTADKTFTIATTSEATTAPADNLLVGMPNGGQVAKAADGEYNYVFGWTEVTNPGFYLVNGTLPTLGAFKAYLHTADALNAPSTSGSRLALSFGGATTGIDEAVREAADSRFFDLQGRSVAQPQKGLYIVNGKKVIIK